MTRSIGMPTVRSSSSSRPTWTWRPRLRRQRDRADAGRGGAERVERDVRAAAGRLDDRRDRVGRGRVDGHRRAERAGERERLRGDVDRHDAGAERGRDEDRRQADAAAAVDGDPLAGRDPPVPVHGGERGHEAAAEARGADEVELLGEPHEVEVGPRQRDELGERAPGGEARLEVLVADLRLPGAARLAAPAAEAERHGHAVADRERPHLRPGGRDHAGQLVAGHVGERDRRVVAHPAVPVAAADAGRPHLHDDPVRGAARGSGTDSIASGSRKACMTAALMRLSVIDHRSCSIRRLGGLSK